MDRALSATLLMLILSRISCSDPKCEGVNKNLPREDLHKIFGDWVLVWSSSDIPNLWETYNASYSEVRLHLQPDNRTVVYEERNHLRNSSCHVYVVHLLADPANADRHALKTSNGTVDYDGHVVPFVDTVHLYLYESNSPNDLVLVCNTEEGQFLSVYRRKGHHTGEELKSHHRHHHDRAPCLGIPVDKPFIYDGVSEPCHECDRMKKKLPREDLHKIFGDWVQVWAAADGPIDWDFYDFTSAWVHLYLDSDNRTVVFHESNHQRNSSCNILKVNMLADPANTHRLVLNFTSATADYHGHVEPIAEVGYLDLYQSDSPDDLVLVYHTYEKSRSLMTYRRKGQGLKSNYKHQEDRAVCMGFPVDKIFVYDGVSEFCERTQDGGVLLTPK